MGRKETDRTGKKEQKIEEKGTVKYRQFDRREKHWETEITPFEGKPLFIIMNICVFNIYKWLNTLSKSIETEMNTT